MSTPAKKSSRAPRTAPRGFTLMELLLVVVLLGVLAGVVFPRLKGTVRAAGLDEAGQRLAAMVRFARAESVRRGWKIRLTLDATRSSWNVALQNTESGSAEDFVGFDDDLLDTEHHLPQGVRIAQIRQGEQAMRTGVLVFTPDGVSEPCTIELADGSGRVSVVKIGPWVDDVTVTRNKEPVP